MSIKHREAVTCPRCGQANDFIVWESLNGDLDPEAKQLLLDGTLFRFECSSCGHESTVKYGMLYHDMMHEAMVYYVDEHSVEEAQAAMDSVGEKLGFGMSGYRKRIVTDQNALREKAIIFDHGLDDRVVEIIKLVYYANASEQFPDENIGAGYFLVEKGKFILEFIGDRPLSTEIPASVYDDIKNDFADRLAAAGNTERIIDVNWALNFLRG